MTKRQHHMETYVGWVCDDCLIKLANDDTSGYAGDDPAVLLSRFPDDMHVVPGMAPEYHSCGTAHGRYMAGLDYGCDCETDDFCTSECAGCSDTLAGRRSAVTCTMWSENYED